MSEETQPVPGLAPLPPAADTQMIDRLPDTGRQRLWRLEGHKVPPARKKRWGNDATGVDAQYPFVIALTHVPPFKDAAWYDGRHSDDNYLPHFACKATGDVMRRIMEANPQSRLLVLCGHTHGSGEVQITDNLQILTGGAEYGHPAIQRIFDIG